MLFKSFLCSRNHTFFSPVSYLILKSPHRKQKDAFLKSFPTPKVSKFVLDEFFLFIFGSFDRFGLHKTTKERKSLKATNGMFFKNL